jgi:hypothetical protein
MNSGEFDPRYFLIINKMNLSQCPNYKPNVLSIAHPYWLFNAVVDLSVDDGISATPVET